MTAFFVILLILIFLYFIAIMPQLWKSQSIASLKGHYYAHRGLYNNESDTPENSLPAFSQAVNAGYGIELDLQLSKDNIPVVFHDFNLKRMCHVDKRVKDLTFQELRLFRLRSSGQTIPSFEEVLTLVGGKVPIIIEYKVELTNCSVCTISNELLKAYKGTYCIDRTTLSRLLCRNLYRSLAVAWTIRSPKELADNQSSFDLFIFEGFLP